MSQQEEAAVMDAGGCPEEGDVAINTICVEELQQSAMITLGSCGESVTYNVGDLHMGSLGRLINLRFRLKNICPNRRVAVGLLLFEVMGGNVEVPRGFRVITVPRHTHPTCRDVVVDNVRFLIPEEDSLTGTLCTPRKFIVRHMHHYIDFPRNCFDPDES